MSWGKIHIDKADSLFSRYVRLKAGKCVRCNRRGSGIDGTTGLQASHFQGRRKESTRFDLQNVDSFCIGCHKYLGTDHPDEYKEFKLKQLGQKDYDLLILRANTPGHKDRKLQAMLWKQELKALEQSL